MLQEALLKLCVVGSGPAGMYSAKYLLKRFPGATIDVLERFPVPFGLARFGVAPDHPEVKSCQEDFAEVLGGGSSHKNKTPNRVRFFGNVNVGEHVSVQELKQMYNAVLLAHGPADGDQRVGLERESEFVYGAREFVNWYNGFPRDVAGAAAGVPDFASILQRTKQVVIIGNGNVALDCARILMERVDRLQGTDISPNALEALSKSTVRQVSVVGRRGHPQAAYTMKELREMTKLDGVQVACVQHELDASRAFDFDSHRPIKRMNDLLRKQQVVGDVASLSEEDDKKKKRFDLRFLLSPRELLVSEDGSSLQGVRFQRTQVDAHGKLMSGAAAGDDESIDLPCQLVLRSVGYETRDLVGGGTTQGFTPRTGYGATELERGVFSVGWCKRGPKGIIGTNVTDAHETVELMCKRAEQGQLLLLTEGGGVRDLKEVLAEREVKVVDWEAYLRIDAEEKRLAAALSNGGGDGGSTHRPRVKLESVEEMLRVAISTVA